MNYAGPSDSAEHASPGLRPLTMPDPCGIHVCPSEGWATGQRRGRARTWIPAIAGAFDAPSPSVCPSLSSNAFEGVIAMGYDPDENALRDRLDELTLQRSKYNDDLANITRSHGVNPDRYSAGVRVRYDNTSSALEEADAEYDEIERALKARRQAKLDEVLRAAQLPGRTESGDGSGRYLGGRGPSFNANRDPYDTDLELVRAKRYDSGDVISRAKRAVEVAPKHLNDAGRQYLTEVLERDDDPLSEGIARHMLLTGSPEYHAEFRQYIRSAGKVIGPEIARAMSEGSAQAGAALVPFTLDPTVILTNLGIEGSIRSLATIKQITTDSWNGVTSDGVTAEWLSELAPAADTSPTFAEVAIPTHKAHAWVVGSYEVLADSNFASQLGMLIADAKMRLEETAFAVGSGTGQPTGLVTAAVATTASRVASAASAALSAADIFNISAAASPRHASRSVWFANKSVYHKVRQFSTVTSGGAFWADMGVGRPSQLIGAATYEASAMDAYAANTTSDLIVLANPKSYVVVDRVGLQLKYVDVVMNTNTNVPIGASGWEAYFRVGGLLVGPSASARVLRQHTTTSGWS